MQAEVVTLVGNNLTQQLKDEIIKQAGECLRLHSWQYIPQHVLEGREMAAGFIVVFTSY